MLPNKYNAHEKVEEIRIRTRIRNLISSDQGKSKNVFYFLLNIRYIKNFQSEINFEKKNRKNVEKRNTKFFIGLMKYIKCMYI